MHLLSIKIFLCFALLSFSGFFLYFFSCKTFVISDFQMRKKLHKMLVHFLFFLVAYFVWMIFSFVCLAFLAYRKMHLNSHLNFECMIKSQIFYNLRVLYITILCRLFFKSNFFAMNLKLFLFLYHNLRGRKYRRNKNCLNSTRRIIT